VFVLLFFYKIPEVITVDTEWSILAKLSKYIMLLDSTPTGHFVISYHQKSHHDGRGNLQVRNNGDTIFGYSPEITYGIYFMYL
jgi:hypothetical protein